jgi:hypothetical protein
MIIVLRRITSPYHMLVIRLPKEKIRLPGEVNRLVILGKTRGNTSAKVLPRVASASASWCIGSCFVLYRILLRVASASASWCIGSCFVLYRILLRAASASSAVCLLRFVSIPERGFRRNFWLENFVSIPHFEQFTLTLSLYPHDSHGR